MIQAMLNGMTAGVGAVILSVVYDMGSDVVKQKDPLLLLLMAASFVAAYFYHVNVIYIILAAALAGICRTIIRKLRNEA